MCEKPAKMCEKQAKNINKITEKYTCEICDYTCCKKDSYKKHLNSIKHKNSEKCEKVAKVAENSQYYVCDLCHYNTNKKFNYAQHLMTAKHKNKSISKKENESVVVDPSSNDIKVITGLMVEIVKSNNDLQKQNQILQKQVLEICQKIQQPIINTNSHNSNNNNKTFNLHFFLNEECKDAMNMSEFIDSIKVKISDLENIGKLGYIEGMSNIIIKQLNDTDVNKRPIHCSDAKRETLYVKEENKWEKETEDTKKMVKAVRDVDKKNYKLLSNWKEIYPECANSKSKQSDEYLKVVNKVMDGDEENVNKVIKRVSKQVLIEK